MKTFNLKFSAFVLSVAACCCVQAGIADRPQGLRFGERLTLRPYVSFDFTYDSNGDQQTDSESQTSWYVNPHLSLDYKSDVFTAKADVFYGYRAYNGGHARSENGHNYGESVSLGWSNTSLRERGWSILLDESYTMVNEDDDLQNNNGRGLWRQHSEFKLNGAIEHRFTEKLHADINGGYYWLDYDNDADRYMNLYGWQRLMAGAEVGYAFTPWTDFLVAGSYQNYIQENCDDRSDYSSKYPKTRGYSRNSQGYTVQAGLQSRATERISYRLLAGWSRFEYGDVSEDDGFTYTAAANWKISDTWNTMLMAQSAYQPSEREYGSANRVDSVSWGLGHTMIRNKLNATFDVAYRRETRVHTDVSSWDYDEDIFSFRLGLDYTINRFLAVYARGEYQRSMFGGDLGGIDRDYDRFRVSVGFRLQY